MPARVTVVGFCVLQVPGSIDELTGEKVKASVSVIDEIKNDRLSSVFCLTHDNDGKLNAVIGFIGLNNNLDLLPLGNNDVSVSYRADGMEFQHGWVLSGFDGWWHEALDKTCRNTEHDISRRPHRLGLPTACTCYTAAGT